MRELQESGVSGGEEADVPAAIEEHLWTWKWRVQISFQVVTGGCPSSLQEPPASYFSQEIVFNQRPRRGTLLCVFP